MPTMLQTCGPRKPRSRGVGSMPSSIGCVWVPSARFFVAIHTLDLESTPGQSEVQGRSYGVVRLQPGGGPVNASGTLASGEVFRAHLIEELPELLDLLFLHLAVLVLLE